MKEHKHSGSRSPQSLSNRGLKGRSLASVSDVTKPLQFYRACD